MGNLNKVLLIGRVGKDAELKCSAAGSAITNFSLATTEHYKDKAGTKAEKTQWHRCVVFGKLAELATKVTKGMALYVEGSISYSEYEKEGVKQRSTDIMVSSIQFLEARKDGEAKPATEQPKNAAEFDKALANSAAADDPSDDLPF